MPLVVYPRQIFSLILWEQHVFCAAGVLSGKRKTRESPGTGRTGPKQTSQTMAMFRSCLSRSLYMTEFPLRLYR